MRNHLIKKEGKSYLIRSNRKSIAEETTVGNYLQLTSTTWSSHVKSIVKSLYGILRALKTLKRFIPLKVRKPLAESLVLSRLN